MALTLLKQNGNVEILTYDVVDRHTGAVVASGLTRDGANRSVGRRDAKYGAYRYYKVLTGKTKGVL